MVCSASWVPALPLPYMGLAELTGPALQFPPSDSPASHLCLVLLIVFPFEIVSM